MDTISAITTSNGISCIIKDAQAREDIQHKVWFKDGDNSGYNDLSVIKLTYAEYEELAVDGNCLSNNIYIISSDYVDAYSKVISNLTMTDDTTKSEAATQHYVDEISTDLTDQLTAYGKTISYDGNQKKIYLRNGTDILGTVDCSNVLSSTFSQIIETYVNGTNGYRVWSDGYCEQWGRYEIQESNVAETITLAKTYNDTYYNIQTTNVVNGTQETSITSRTSGIEDISTITTSSFQVYRDKTCIPYVYWKTSGQLAAGQY